MARPRVRASTRRRSWVRAGLLALLAVAATLILALRPRSAARPSSPSFVGIAVCAGCHPARQRSWSTTRHALASALVGDATPPPTALVKLDFGVEVEVSASGARQHERWPGGGLDLEARLAIGSGRHGRSFAAEQPDPHGGSHLVLMPATYYPSQHGFAPSPLMERMRPGGLDELSPTCLACHTTTVALAGGRAVSAEPPIGCERCHGPGSTHAAACTAKADDCRTTIVMPAKLEPARALDLCAQCHTGSRGTREHDGGLLAFRPGGRLDDVVTTNPEAGPDDDLEISSQLERLRASRCFGAELTCLTCHDPHRPPDQDHARARAACTARCHDETSCRESPERRHASGKDCAGCHMPEAWVKDARSWVIDHRIRVVR